MNQEGEEYWFLSLPLGENKTRDAVWRRLLDRTGGTDLCAAHKFSFPELRVGTLDSLLALSDDLTKVCTFVESVAHRISRQLHDLCDYEPNLHVNDVPLETFATRFQWDEAKFPAKSPLRELVDKVSESLSRLEDTLKVRTQEYNTTKSELQQLQRKDTGSLAVRDLSSCVNESHMVESEHLVTLLVVVPIHSTKDWLGTYENMAAFVVPRSSKLVIEEGDYALYTVTLFRRTVDEFKAAARQKGLQVRDHSHDPEKIAARAGEMSRLGQDLSTKRRSLQTWCEASYGEAFSGLIHLSAIRLFVDSILRYGLPPAYLPVLVKPTKRTEKKLREVLRGAFADHQYSRHWERSEEVSAKDAMAGMDDTSDSHAYVSFSVHF
mmetsp:Transcript_962/g.3438  ORF Transcript_962/g.3438 Transcript_962/m.3438 type:complete len:379 (-) Transcript_962:993-2129(-)